jgi:hypothetical protein
MPRKQRLNLVGKASRTSLCRWGFCIKKLLLQGAVQTDWSGVSAAARGAEAEADRRVGPAL